MTDDFGFVEVKGKKDRVKMWSNSAEIKPKHFYSISVFKWNDKNEVYDIISRKPTGDPKDTSDLNEAVSLFMKDKKFTETEFFYKAEVSANALFLSKSLAIQKEGIIIEQYKIQMYSRTNGYDKILTKMCNQVLSEYVEACWKDSKYTQYPMQAGFNIWITDIYVHSPDFLKVRGAISARCRVEGENMYLEIIVYPHEVDHTPARPPPTLTKFIEDLAEFHNYKCDSNCLSTLINKDEGEESIAKTHIREALLGLKLTRPTFTITEVSTESWPTNWQTATVDLPKSDPMRLDNRKTSSIIRRCRLTEEAQKNSVDELFKTFSEYLNNKKLPFELEKNRTLDATLLELPALEFADNKKEQSVNGEWNVHKFKEGATVGKWLVMYTSDVPKETLETLIAPLVETAKEKGMKLPFAPEYSKDPLKETDGHLEFLGKLLDSQKIKRYDFVMLFCNSESCVPELLRVFAKQNGIILMVMRLGNLSEKTILSAQKMNALNGGVCAKVSDTAERTSGKDLHIGISYGIVGDKKVAGLCAFSWRSLVEQGFYKDIDDFAAFICLCNKICKEKYKERNEGEEPERVYYYISRVPSYLIAEIFETNRDWEKTTLVTVISVRPEFNLKLFPIVPYKAPRKIQKPPTNSKSANKKNKTTEQTHQHSVQTEQHPTVLKTAVGSVVKIKKDVFLMCSYAPYFDTPQIYRYTVVLNGTKETDTQLQAVTLKLCHQHLANISKKMPYIAFFADTKIVNEKKRYHREVAAKALAEEESSRKQSMETVVDEIINEEEMDLDVQDWVADDYNADDEDTLECEVSKLELQEDHEHQQ